MRIDSRTIENIRNEYPGAYIETFDAGVVYDEATDTDVAALDVIVWESEDDSHNDDGTNAIDRALIRA